MMAICTRRLRLGSLQNKHGIGQEAGEALIMVGTSVCKQNLSCLVTTIGGKR